MRIFVISSFAALLAACGYYGQPPRDPAYAGASDGRQCFYAANVTGFRQGPNNSIIVNTNSRDYYELQPLGGYCADFDFEHRIALRSRSGNFVCSGYDAEIYVPDAIGVRYCPVRSMRKLTEAEVAEMKARD